MSKEKLCVRLFDAQFDWVVSKVELHEHVSNNQTNTRTVAFDIIIEELANEQVQVDQQGHLVYRGDTTANTLGKT
jgi:hypothetical protein